MSAWDWPQEAAGGPLTETGARRSHAGFGFAEDLGADADGEACGGSAFGGSEFGGGEFGGGAFDDAFDTSLDAVAGLLARLFLGRSGSAGSRANEVRSIDTRLDRVELVTKLLATYHDHLTDRRAGLAAAEGVATQTEDPAEVAPSAPPTPTSTSRPENLLRRTAVDQAES